MSKIDNIARNTSYLTVALILQKVISFTYFTLLARYVGPADLGKYYFAISFTTLFAIFMDLGLANVLTRETAKDREGAKRWLGNIISIKLPLAVLISAAVLIFINVFSDDQLVRRLVAVSVLAMVFDSFTSIFYAVIRGFHNLKYESIASVVFQLIVLVVGYSALLLGGGLLPAMAALALASLYNFSYAWIVLVRRMKVIVRPLYDPVLIRKIIMISWPFAVYGILQRLHVYLDSVLLSFFSGDVQVGLYQVAFKIIFALQFLPMAFVASLYPAMSAYWREDRERLSGSFERALSYLTIISLPVIIGTMVLADKITLLFKSGYEDAAWPLRISVAALFFIFANFPIGSLLNACDSQKKNTRNMGIVALSSIILNIALIPYWQALGASITVFVSNGIMFLLGLISARRIIKYNFRKISVVFLKSIAAAGLMGLAVFVLKGYINIFLAAGIGALLYFFFLFIFKGFDRGDIISIRDSFRFNRRPKTELQ